ncbi:MAG: hypothetical protein JNJ45_02630 [Chthonomonas sp.]|nr:hypothetical protein [Chthonomonas sp.]
MDVRTALKNQHHAALAMMRQAIEAAPEHVWLGGEHPRNYWRIAFHALAYAHLYLFPNLAEWEKWEHHRQDCTYLEGDDVPVAEPYTRAQMLEFCEVTDQMVDAKIDVMDLDEPTCGYTWYPTVSRLELQILSLRHLHGHIGQLTEIMIANGLDVTWLGGRPTP